MGMSRYDSYEWQDIGNSTSVDAGENFSVPELHDLLRLYEQLSEGESGTPAEFLAWIKDQLVLVPGTDD